MAKVSVLELEQFADSKIAVFKKFLDAQPPMDNGEKVLTIWEELYCDKLKSVVVETLTGPSDDESNPVCPYEKLEAIVGDGGSWKWPRMWQHLDEIERRGDAFREGEVFNFGRPNKAPNIAPMNVLVVGGGPVGMRLSIEFALAGHRVTQVEKRREEKENEHEWKTLGFTNRINRPHMWPFVRNDLAKLNGKDFLQQKVQYPVFTEPNTSSIGIDELQCLLLKNALLLGVDFRLGVAYKNATVRTDADSMMPSWDCELHYDDYAATQFGMEKGKNVVNYDVLIGCDGPRSTVRDTMTKYLGDVEKRKFMDCVGIVANVRKVSKKRLLAMGFEYGQEPNDMNRTKLIFKDFFNKLNEEADADLEALIYYKASFHNYTILTPKRANLVKHGLSGKVYHHTVARAALDGDPKTGEKAKLKAYCARVLQVAGIPVDTELENGGFVDAPNDVMAFDFAECWNTKRSIAFEYPPPGYSVAADGPWMGRKTFPFVALAGDSLLEPFWPMGLGLKRGWHAIFDTCWAVDNLFNPECTSRILKKDQVSWEEHFECLGEQIAKNLEYCKRLMITDELGRGEYDEKGSVMVQMRKKNKDAERPAFLVEVDPWTRYKILEKEFSDHAKYGLTGEDKDNWLHPVVLKELAKIKFYEDLRKHSKQNEFVHAGKKLSTLEGRAVEEAGAKAVGEQTTGGGAVAKAAVFTRPRPVNGFKRRPAPAVHAEPVVHKPCVNEVGVRAAKMRASLVESMMAGQMDTHVTAKAGAAKNPLLAEMMTGHPAGGDSHAETAEDNWNRATEKHLTPATEAELAHVRNMIAALSKSLDAYKTAEQQLCASGKNDTSLQL